MWLDPFIDESNYGVKLLVIIAADGYFSPESLSCAQIKTYTVHEALCGNCWVGGDNFKRVKTVSSLPW